MEVIGEKWRCPTGNVDVGGSMGEFRKHIIMVHNGRNSSTRVAAA
jgi:hypothetical protein